MIKFQPDCRGVLAALCRAAFAVALALGLSLVAQEAPKRQVFDIPAGDARVALKAFSNLVGEQLLFGAAVDGVQTRAVSGTMTTQQALDTMLAGTGLVADYDGKTKAFAIRRETSSESKNDSSRPAGSRTAKIEDGALKLEKFEVMESKLLNMDVKRSRDDPQPYVIMDRAAIELSGVNNVEDLLKIRLPQNTLRTANSQIFTSTGGNMSQINLRGLGTNQTLILIDGHRAPGVGTSGAPTQPDVNGIPLAAIERVEILPTTASGIYGGNATGGVINIILRRDYSGVEIKLTYENTFESDSALRRIDFGAGFTLAKGKTSVMIAGTTSTQNSLARQDRPFLLRDRQLYISNAGDPTALSSGGVGFEGSTPNIRSTDGSNLVLKNGKALNSPITYVPPGYAGIQTDGGAALAANAGQYNYAGWGQSYYSLSGGLFGIFNAPTLQALTASVRSQFTPKLQGFIDVGLSNNVSDVAFSTVDSSIFPGIVIPDTSPSNPFRQSIYVRASLDYPGRLLVATRDRRAVAGLIARLPRDWTAELDVSVDRVYSAFESPTGNPPALAGLLTNGTIALIKDTSLYPIDLSLAGSPIIQSTVKAPIAVATNYSGRASGPVLSLPGGFLTLSGSAEHRRETVSDYTVASATAAPTVVLGGHQMIDSAYLEFRAPLVSQTNARVGLQGLELQLAGRGDRYSLHGATRTVYAAGAVPADAPRGTNTLSSINPTFAVKYVPLRDLTFRASYGTGFLVPSLSQIVTSRSTGFSNFSDSHRGLTTGTVPAGGLLTGGSADLKPEKSRSLSFGAVLTPRSLPGARLSVDYVRINKSDAITTLSVQQITDNESSFPGRVIRGPKLPGDAADWEGPVISVDATAVNALKALVEAYDVALDYQRDTVIGNFSGFVAATWETHFKQQFAFNGPYVENVGFGAGPLKFKGNAGITWSKGAFSLSWTTRYFDSYRAWASTASAASITSQIKLQGDNGTIPSQTYHDVSAGYRFGDIGKQSRAALLVANTEVRLGVKNIFNKAPPFDSAGFVQYLYSQYGDARMATYYLSLKRSF